MKRTVEEQFRTLCIVWAVLLLAQFMFLFVLSQAKSEVFRFDLTQPILGKNPAVVIGFAAMALVNLAISFVIKKRCFDQAIADKNPRLVQSGIIIACAFCEAVSIFGMLLAFLFAYPYFFIWFGLGILGILSHIPRRKDLYAAVGS
jgi:F0F1-type ATP synthase membrane subunit c/vacuolar-type H+-ATPase subunit K